MKRKTLSLLFVLAFLLLLLPESLGLLLPQPAAAGNEILAPAPRLQADGGGLNLSVLNELTDYLADRFALRQPMIGAWARLHALLGSSPEPQVLQGRGGWLYYSETLPDYSGVSLPDDALRHIAGNLALAQEALASEGSSFVFVVAPNKNSLYPGFMPAAFPRAHARSNAARLLPLLREQGVTAADLFAAFGAQDEVLYFALDSHWNSRGAALAADVILAALGRESAWFSAPFAGSAPHRGDLYDMLYPTGQESENDPVPTAPFVHRTAADPRRGEALTIETFCDAAEGELFCWRDSFGNSLYPWLAEAFAHARFSRAASYDLSRAAGADCVVLELVERNLPRLWESAPVFAAPPRETPAAAEADERLLLHAERQGELLRLSAALPREWASGAAPLLEADGQCYACCVSAGEDENTVCVSACIRGEAPRETALIIEQNGELRRYAAALAD